MTDLLEKTDIESLINSAFKDLECIAPTQISEHGGDIAAFYNFHDCLQGWVCLEHHKIAPVRIAEQFRECTARGVAVVCSRCFHIAWTIDDWVKIYPL